MEVTRTPFEALNACLAIAETQFALAEALGCSQTAVWKMLQTRRMSHQFVLVAEKAYNVPRWELRPDLYPPREYMTDQARGARFIGIDRDAQQVAM